MAPPHFARDSTASSVIAFSHNLPLLAAATLPAPGLVPSLSILRASTTGEPAAEIFSAIDCFPSPAAFRSVAWSGASSHTSAAGFVAGGLDNGVVTIWDSYRARDLVLGDSSAADHDYFSGSQIQKRKGEAAGPEAPPPAAQDDVDKELAKILKTYDFLENERMQQPEGEGRSVLYGREEAWTPPCLYKLRDNYAMNKFPTITRDDGAVAYFRHAYDDRNKTPVRGLSFNSVESHLLSSVAGNTVVLWDLSCSQSESVPTWENVSSSPIACMSWSNSRNMLACASDQGIITLYDIRSKSPASICKTPPKNGPPSCLKFNPNNQNEFAVSLGALSDEHSVWIWDMKMPTPLWKTCDRSGGTKSISWSKGQNLILIGTNNSNIKILRVKDQEIISELSTGTTILDLCWSNTADGSFVVSFDKKLVAYALV